MNNWEYRITSLPALELSPSALPAGAAVERLNAHGGQGWEVVGMTTVANNECVVLMKRPVAQVRSSGGRV
jgi:hypothetical protein